MIRSNQDYFTKKFAYLSLMSLVISLIIAVTMRITIPDDGEGLEKAINTLWLIGLVLGVSSFMHSLLAVALYSLPSYLAQTNIPSRHFMHLWFDNMPMYTTATAALLYVVGICLFSFATKQVRRSLVVTLHL